MAFRRVAGCRAGLAIGREIATERSAATMRPLAAYVTFIRDGVSSVKHNHFDKQTKNSEVKGKSLICFPINSQHNKTQNISCLVRSQDSASERSGPQSMPSLGSDKEQYVA